MRISVVNHTAIPDGEVQRVIRALNRQIAEDFEPAWSMGAELRLEGRGMKPTPNNPGEMRGDAVIYLWDDPAPAGVLGFHDKNGQGLPFGIVFTTTVAETGRPWSHTLSHEALELLADPEGNLLVRGPHPHPKRKGRFVFYWYEMCDAVQDEFYEIDGVVVSNFVLPLYFTSGDERRGRNDFLGLRHGRMKLHSFGVNPGGYVGFYDPKTGKDHTYMAEGDARAAELMQIKKAWGRARRTARRGAGNRR
ncbi:MAG: hypothetical protein HYZ13_09020 [Acidobacteria bacterium]|nr:hypothetical protein [Acidobacteriota bacterium]